MTAPVLGAVDLTALAGGTARFASVLARLAGARVTLLHVREPGEPEEEVAERLASLARAVAGADLEVTTESAQGDPAEAIVRRAAALGASAIVLGTHGGRGLERLMLGSVAETVLHRAGRPVATLRGPEHAAGPIRRIVCGVDLEDTAPLLEATRLAALSSAELVAVHAVKDLPEEGVRGLVPASYAPALLEEARRRVGRTVSTVTLQPERVRTLVVPGSPSRALVRIAGEESADLLVVGVHRHVLGSTTHPVVRGAHCPVLTIPPGGAGAVGGREIA
ncbi:MAG TPA: universal stress protein [Thermoanaerobaculia bacterium]|nr:universal stress protein [Thermoanaerobaculia bacterium]